MLQKIKIVVVGGQNSGKSLLSNIVSGHITDPNTLQDYARPTTGVRILEFEHELQNQNNVDIELWDTSGDLEQEQLWPAFTNDMAGVVILDRGTGIESFIDYFVENSKLQPEQSLLWLNKDDGHSPSGRPVGGVVSVDVLSDVEQTKLKFSQFLDRCAEVETKKQERAERSIVA